MQLPLGLGRVDWTDWVRGLLASFIIGGSNAVVSGGIVAINDPQKYAVGTFQFFELIASVFVVSGTLNMLSFLRTKPIPDLKIVTKIAQNVTEVSPTSINVNTVTETRIEPIRESRS